MTESMNAPNLFSFATSELSQDAFICWLLSWADPEVEQHNPALHATACDFVEALLRPHGFDDLNVYSIEVRRQERKADVVAFVNDEVILLIEDKIHAPSHSNQLERYKADFLEIYDGYTLAPVYLKTGSQSQYKKAGKAGYSLFLRSDFLDVLERGAQRDPGSDIFSDYHRHLKEMNRRINSFATEPVGEWPGAAWQGFYQVLQQELERGDWDYVNNQSGGFWAYYWHYQPAEGCRVYLQLEEGRLCFKVKVKKEEDYSRLRNQWHRRIKKTAERHQIDVARPSRFGHGEHMTVAHYPGDYRAVTEDGVIDLDETIHRLRRAERLVTNAVSIHTSRGA
jgi:hypothetical protein